jgi:hypothetical protein
MVRVGSGYQAQYRPGSLRASGGLEKVMKNLIMRVSLRGARAGLDSALHLRLAGVESGRAVRASVSWPALPAGCANGAKRSAAPLVLGMSGWL